MSFPFEPESVKTESKGYTQTFNNGTSCHISSYFNGYQTVNDSANEYWWTYTKNANNPSDVVSIRSYITATSGHTTSWTDVQYVMNSIFSDPQQSGYYETDEYNTAKEDVENALVWIWGNIDDGGLFVFRNAPSEVSFGMCNGFFYYEVGGGPGEPTYNVYGYDLYPVASALNVSAYDWDSVCFFYHASDANEHTGTGASIYQTFATMFIGNGVDDFVVASWQQGLSVYDVSLVNQPMSIIEQLTPIWIDDDPAMIFAGSMSGYMLYDRDNDYSNFIHLEGNPYGDMSIDDETNPYYDSGFNDQGGGGASLDNNVDTSNPEDVDIDNNSVDVCSSNLVLMYNPTSAEISAFNNFLYSGITDSIANTLKKLTSDPLQYIISLGLVHFDPPTSTRNNISFGGIDTGVAANRISKQMKSFDFGYIDLRNEFKSFIDYNSRASIFLPYIGYREIDINEVRGSRIRLKYNIDMLTGSCVAYLHISRDSRGNGDCRIYNNMYFFEGNCMLQIPMFATDNRGTIQALMNTLGAGVSLATGNVAGAVTSAVNAATQQKVSVGRAGTIGSNYGYMGGQEAFIVIERPIISTPLNFGSFEGWTSNIYRKISSLQGYTETDPETVWSNNIHCTDNEAAEIRNLFNSGVYL